MMTFLEGLGKQGTKVDQLEYLVENAMSFIASEIQQPLLLSPFDMSGHDVWIEAMQKLVDDNQWKLPEVP